VFSNTHTPKNPDWVVFNVNRPMPPATAGFFLAGISLNIANQ